LLRPNIRDTFKFHGNFERRGEASHGSPFLTKWQDPDEAPELTEEFFANAEVFEGNRFIRRGPGRPKTGAAKEQISVRLDPDVIAKLREAGPGWQTQINALLRKALGLVREPA
jgi:uncharacterized protein (DUF4415 family)